MLTLGAAVMTPAIYALTQTAKHLSIDWYLFGGLFVVALLAVVFSSLALVKISHSQTPAIQEQLKPCQTPATIQDDLKEKMKQLGHDMFSFLREKASLNPGVGKIEAIDSGYERKFKQRIKDLVNELKEHQLYFLEIEDRELYPEIQNVERIRNIASAFFMAAVKIEIGEASKGT
ncbi:MAG: hypothetical protein LAP21_05935 [Acidobacteriia bacterium]|nr:hypothetical protein [Terriglobia bacterium]